VLNKKSYFCPKLISKIFNFALSKLLKYQKFWREPGQLSRLAHVKNRPWISTKSIKKFTFSRWTCTGVDGEWPGVGPKMEEGFVWMGGGYAGWPHGGSEFHTNHKCSRYLVLEAWCYRDFSVKSTYSIVELASRVDVVAPKVSKLILAKVWKSWAPSKVIVFS
jgi:hypothetical protein